MKTIRIYIFLILVCIIPLNAQWTTFELDNVDSEDFQTQIEPFFNAISIFMTQHSLGPNNINNRISLGISYSQGLDISGKAISKDLIGGYPNLSAKVLITNNFTLNGNLNLIRSNNDVVQSFAIGFGLNITNKDVNNWRLSVLFAQLQGPGDLNNRSTSAIVFKEFQISSFPLFAGLCLNTYNVKILLEDRESIPKSVKGSAHHLLIGTHKQLAGITFTPTLQLNSKVVIFSIALSGNFK